MACYSQTFFTMTQNDEHEFKKMAFGVLPKIKARHGFKPDARKLKEPLRPGTMRFFCTGCGIYHTFSKEAVDELQEFIPDFPGDMENWFLETGCCSACDSSNTNVEMRKVSDVDASADPSEN